MSGCRFLSTTVVALTLLLLCSGAEVFAAGDAKQGEALFVGKAAFSNGGAPCLACHNLAGFGMADGANYGPDLSTLYDNYGSEGLEAILPSLPFPSMEAIYASRPLIETEQADLIAFLQQTSQLSATPDAGKLVLLVFIGVAILLGLTFLVGLRRMRATRQPLIDQQRNLINKGGLK